MMARQRVSSSAVVQRLQRAGKFAAALTVGQQLLEQARELHDEEQVLTHLEEVAYLQFELGEFEEALAANAEMLEIHRQRAAGEVTPEVVADLSRNGFLLLWAGRYEAAEEDLQQALELVLQLPAEQRYEQPAILLNLGCLAHERGDHEAAIKLMQQAWARGHDLRSDLHTALNTLLHLADAYRDQGRPELAKAWLGKGVRTFDDDDYLPYAALTIAHLHYKRGSLQYEAGQHGAALVSFRRALLIVERWGGENISRRDEFVERIQHKILRVSRGSE